MLGVGAAISLGQGIAWADDTPQTGPASGSTASGSVSSQTPGAPNSRRGAPPGSATPSDSGLALASATAKTDTANAISAARTPKNGAAVNSRGAQQPRTGQSEPPSNTTARSGNESSTPEAPTGDRGSSAPPTTTSDTTTIDTGAGKADRLFSRKPV